MSWGFAGKSGRSGSGSIAVPPPPCHPQDRHGGTELRVAPETPRPDAKPSVRFEDVRDHIRTRLARIGNLAESPAAQPGRPRRRLPLALCPR